MDRDHIQADAAGQLVETGTISTTRVANLDRRPRRIARSQGGQPLRYLLTVGGAARSRSCLPRFAPVLPLAKTGKRRVCQRRRPQERA